MNQPLSNCCTAPANELSEELGICPECHEPCDFLCDHEWEYRDDSFDHEFGTERIPPYEICLLCDETRPCISKADEYAIEKADQEYNASKED